MDFLRKYPIHPLCFAIYPVISLFSANYYQVVFAEIFRALILSMVSASLVVCLLHFFRLDWLRSGIMVSILAVLFFSYGHVLQALASATLKGNTALSPLVVTILWPVIAIITIWTVIRLLREAEPVNVFLNVVGVALVVISAGQIIMQAFPFTTATRISKNSLEFSQQNFRPIKTDNLADLPDMYYIILDGYGREDQLLQIIGYDNSIFLSRLEEIGFWVASGSTANYSNTTPSLASSMNFSYVDELSQKMDPLSKDYRPLRRLIAANRIQDFLRERGYTIVNFESSFNFTDIRGAGKYVILEDGPNYFESLLLTNSLSVLWTTGPFADRYRDRINKAFTRLANLSNIPSPKFVFVHIMAVHPPFVFGADGEAVSQAGAVELDQDDADRLQAEVEGYRGQLQYINRLIVETVQTILENSSVEPIIILQGDHGSGIYMDWQSMENTCFTERMAIFNAYYLPDGGTELLYDTITPVNTFRIVLNLYFGQELPMLEDRNYFSLWESPYLITDITGQSGNCPVH